jgi:hypothetical protein
LILRGSFTIARMGERHEDRARDRPKGRLTQGRAELELVTVAEPAGSTLQGELLGQGAYLRVLA